jgi:parallel beta-helix repeat protein
MSFTLRGRLETRFATALVALAAAVAWSIVVEQWWPVQLAGLMLAVGVVLDSVLWNRLDYQPGWAALPLGAVELAAVMVLAWALGVGAPLRHAVALFAGAWLAAQILGHALFPLWRLTYAEDGGELGAAGAGVAAAALAVLASAGGIAWATQPPTVHLAAGVHAGPIVIDRSQRLVGEAGAVVRGGIVIRTDNVVLEDVAVQGGENGIDVKDAENVRLENVRVLGARLDGIHVRSARVSIHDCAVAMTSRIGQGIDISFAMSRGMSEVRDCRITGGQEGIAVHLAEVSLRENEVSGASLRGIAVTEMSHGSVERNVVHGTRGVGIYCGDYSHCDIEENTVSGVEGVLAYFGSRARLRDNALEHGASARLNSQLVHD